MPVIEVHLLEGYNASEHRRLGEALTDATRMVVPASPELITVMIHEMPADNYYRGRTTRKPASALPDPCEIVLRFLDHLGSRDLDKARTLVSADFEMLFPGAPAMHDLQMLVDWSKPRYQSIKKQIDSTEAMHSAGDEIIVYCRGTLSGVWPDGSHFSDIRFIDRFELINGIISKQEVWNDLAEVKHSTVIDETA